MVFNSPRLEWGAQFRTGIKILDEQHQVLFDLTNGIEDALMATPLDRGALERSVEGVVSYAMYHFVTEESLAYRLGATSKMGEHLRQHHDFRERLSRVRADVRADDPEVAGAQLLRYLKHWWVTHILSADIALGREILLSEDGRARLAAEDFQGLSIAVVEDNRDLREEIVFFLSHIGHRVVGLENGMAFNRHMAEDGSSVIILDLGLPDIDGMELMERYGGRDDIAIVVMTARDSVDDRIAGYRGGADAYLVKPVDLRELVAVVDHVAKRLYPSKRDNKHAWRYSASRRTLGVPAGGEIPLTEQQAALIGLFAAAGRRVLTRQEIVQALGWASEAGENERVEQCLSRLRHRLEQGGVGLMPLKTIRGVGYSFTAPLIAVD